MWNADRLPTIEAPRVRLRWLTEDDVPALYELFRSDEVTRFWSCPAYTELRQAEELLADIRRGFETRSLYQWGLAGCEDDRVVGTLTLWQLDTVNRRAEIGFALDRRYWGQGLMSEGLRALLVWSFDELELRRIEADVDPGNTAALRLLEGLGFQREGLLRERWEVNGAIQDSVMLGLLARKLER